MESFTKSQRKFNVDSFIFGRAIVDRIIFYEHFMNAKNTRAFIERGE